MLEGRDIICIAPGYWDSPWITHQQVMNLLARKNRVLYVEPPLSYLPFRYPERWKKFTAFAHGVRQEQENLWVTCCPPTLPFKRAVNAINLVCQRAMMLWVRRATRKLGLERPLLWVFLPTAVEIAEGLDHDFLLYHCIDEFGAVSWGRSSVIASQEKRLLERADLTVTCSPTVNAAKKQWARNIINIPNGVDFDHYFQAQTAATEVPANARPSNGEKVIGFCGVLDHRIDTDFLHDAAHRYPDCRFVMVGPQRKSFRKLKKIPNVSLLGNRPLESLPGYMKGFDVCLIPYRMNDFVRSISPTKLHEYLASGKPVVAPRLNGLEALGHLVHLADSPGEMVDLIAVALANTSTEAAKARTGEAARNTWRDRVEAICREIRSLRPGDGP